jgi:hypothetical protein
LKAERKVGIVVQSVSRANEYIIGSRSSQFLIRLTRQAARIIYLYNSIAPRPGTHFSNNSLSLSLSLSLALALGSHLVIG